MGAEGTGWAVMIGSVAALCCLILALVHLPALRPSADVLRCDSEGGYWSSTTDVCRKSDSPAAGMAS